ncbi:hypothetical protein Cylst_5955 [Cylindrospermum stagnale PCC 7417]|uniref:Uncharacterized protein n=1 Tax=Cylindrospermum stagnale PCC 7417 TaxID=56107 RepID=K9X5J6_9NOST|nr:hypothetical protein Cylst_5955 [Cylindrospermum stagnale PCC 7417]
MYLHLAYVKNISSSILWQDNYLSNIKEYHLLICNKLIYIKYLSTPSIYVISSIRLNN